MFAGLILLVIAGTVQGQVSLPAPSGADPVFIQADSAQRWTQGEYEVWVLEGQCSLRQGPSTAVADRAVIWIERAKPGLQNENRVLAYFEGRVRIERPSKTEGNPIRVTDSQWFGRFTTAGAIRVDAGRELPIPPQKPEIYERALAYRMPKPDRPSKTDPEVRPAQFSQLIAGTGSPSTAPIAARRIRVFPRSTAPVQAAWFPDRATNQWIGIIDSGVNLIVDGLPDVGTIDVSADRVVLWTRSDIEPNLTGEQLQAADIPLELYLEGNIVFRQGERVIRATRMYYDVTNRMGTILEAELLTPVPEYEGLLRLRAEVLQQMGKGEFFARNSFITSSRMGDPGYRLQAGSVHFQESERLAVNPLTGQPAIDPMTGEPLVRHDRMLTGRNGLLYLGPVPVFYWPFVATDATEPNYYVRSFSLHNDNVFGFQILSGWDGYQLFGIKDKPEGTEWDISLDYLSKRGLGHGTTFTYSRETFLGTQGPATGLVDFWGIKDHGVDNLGRGRRGLIPNRDYRYRLYWNHRQMLPADLLLTAEVGWISDRNFLEEYFEQEWDQLKDPETGVELRHTQDNRSWALSVDGRLNDFFTETEWLPRLDHFWLGQPLLNDVFTWYEHSNLGYARLRQASEPSDPQEASRWILEPWDYSREGVRFATRHELDWPLQLGPVKTVPYALGEYAHWGQDINRDDLDRLYWQAGIRASLPMSHVDSSVESRLWNVHGLAHKVVFKVDASISGANQDLDRLPMYDQLDDYAISAFRYRMPFNTFGVPSIPPVPTFPYIPSQFDERHYALRYGMGSWVTASATEIADDLATVRLGVNQRWQTKRGRPDKRRILDWVTLDTNLTLFPDPDRDDFGKVPGLFDYDFRWHVGDRTTLVSDGYADFFDDGLKTFNVGAFITRPPRGRLYVGFRTFDGPFQSRVMSISYDYRMSPKWVSTFGTSFDLGRDGNIGQNFSITRIGESLLISAGFTVDASRDNVGVNLAIEPRFLPKKRLGNIGGAEIPSAGAYGLE